MMAIATLYHGEPNGPSLTVIAALLEKQVEADFVRIDLAAGERHSMQCEHGVEIDMSIEGEGPVLVVDGEAMADSVFLAVYLDDVGSGPALRPADPYKRWETMMWCRQTIERVAPAAAFLGTRAHLAGKLGALNEGQFEAITSRIRSNDLKVRWEKIRAGDYPADQVADSETKIAQAAQKVEAKLADGRDWLMVDFTIADLETYGWLAGMAVDLPALFAETPLTNAWLARVKARPSVERALSLASHGDPRTSWAPGPEINRWG